MKSLNRRLAIWFGGAALLGGSIFGCRADCEEKLNCGPYEPDADAGSSGAGSGGLSGAGTSGSGIGTSGSMSGGNAGTSGSGTSGEAGAGAATNAGSGGTDSSDGGSGDGGSGDGACDEGGSPRLESCLIAEDFAVFVSAGGAHRAAGTREDPVATVGRAIAMAQASGRAVIACSGTYDEIVTVSGAPGVRVYGGFDCENDWAPSAEKSVLAPSEGTALRVEGTGNAVVFEDFGFQSPDASTPGGSSIAVFVVDATNVTLRRAALTAGKGADAETPTTPGFAYPEVSTLAGRDATEEGGGAADACECPGDVVNLRAKGGDAVEDGAIGLPDHDGLGGEAGVSTASCSSGGSGSDGAAGPAGSSASGATVRGALTSSAWIPEAGKSAGAGSPGQGGGGGAGKPGGGGGSGACGGCGGEGGPGGGGGGASIGLVSIDSKVTLEHVDVTTANAGDGADGAEGQRGQEIAGGGGAGFGSDSERGCFGGNGGPGGNGGRGGGGAGGISVGLVYRGDQPELDVATIVFGTPGDGGIGGDPDADEDDGVEGVAQETLAMP
jgi:hypothetical protein